MSNLLNSPQMLIRLHHDILTSVNAIQGDTGRMWNFVIDDYEIPTNAEIRLYIEKPSGKRIYNPGILQDDIISFQPTEQTLAEIGQSIGQIQITLNKQTVTSYPFFLNVRKNYVLNAGIESTDEFLILDSLIDDVHRTLVEMKAVIQTVTTQENQRVNAENIRLQAEEKRQTDTNNAIAEARAATVSANNAALNAESKANLAKSAADNAVTSASTADNSAALADRAKEEAIQASIKANDAAKKALDAIDGIQGAVGGVINDTQISVATTYSSDKIHNLIGGINVMEITNSQIDSLEIL